LNWSATEQRTIPMGALTAYNGSGKNYAAAVRSNMAGAF
jgi:hypothetical protein